LGAVYAQQSGMLEIVIATSNPHKIEEMNAIFAEIAPGLARFRSLSDACPGLKLVEPAETGTTFEANATIKALSYAEQTGLLCLADDSGLEIDALGGKPGVISSHYSTDGRETGLSRAERDQANNARVLRELETVPDERRGARFVCVMVLAGSHGGKNPSILTSARGTFEGRMARKASGGGGFGYDPLFLVGPDFTRSSAELSAAEKNTLSHRGAAARSLIKAIGGMAHLG
jgi:XTP/dITP diphosphohydrolase